MQYTGILDDGLLTMDWKHDLKRMMCCWNSERDGDGSVFFVNDGL